MTLGQYLYSKCFDENLQVGHRGSKEQCIIAQIYLAKTRGEKIYYYTDNRWWGYQLENGTRFSFKRR